MSDPKSVSPYACLPLLEEAVPTGNATPDAFRLPASFPAELLTEDQLAEVQLWFDSWVSDLLHAVRCALVGGQDGTDTADLPHLHRHATVLAHLLRLHPAAEASITDLATAMGCSRRALFYVRDAVMRHIRPALVGVIASKNSAAYFYAQLATIGTLDADAARNVNPRTLMVPFKPAVHVAHRFATVQQLAAIPAVASVRETLTASGRNAVQITLKSC